MIRVHRAVAHWPRAGDRPLAVILDDLAMRPVAHSLGDLSLLLGRERDAADYFAEGVTVAERCSSAHWARPARAASTELQARSK